MIKTHKMVCNTCPNHITLDRDTVRCLNCGHANPLSFAVAFIEVQAEAKGEALVSGSIRPDAEGLLTFQCEKVAKHLRVTDRAQSA